MSNSNKGKGKGKGKRKRPPRHVELGIKFGLIVPGWGLKDYIQRAAVAPDGYETIIIDGVQRAGKSNLSLQAASWAKSATLREKLGREPTQRELWEATLDQIVFKPSDFVNTLEEVPDEDPLDVLVWDDINAHYTSSTFKTDIKQYAAVDATFTVIGTKCKVIIANIPNIGRLAKNIKDNATFEIFVGRNKLRKMMRLFRLPGIKHLDMNLFKVDIEQPSKFDIYRIPDFAWRRYERERQRLANEALGVLKQATDMEEMDGYIPITEASKICKQNGINWGVSTIQQNISRSVLVGQKVNNQLCVEKESLMEVIEVEKLEIEDL